jgi:hypothetical protein
MCPNSKIASCNGPEWLQDDVECDFGFERVNGQCRAIKDLDTAKCPAIRSGSYHVSQSMHRLINADACSDVSRVISDTDGKGNLPGGPGSGRGGRRGHGKAAKAFIALLVRVTSSDHLLSDVL